MISSQVPVYKELRALLQERDKNAFGIICNNFVSGLLSKKSTLQFGKYFESQYLHNVHSWAYCFRTDAGLNTNMHIERMHGTIKYLYLDGKHVKRLDTAINAIMKYTRDKLFDRLITLSKGKISSKLLTLRRRHRTSQTMDANMVVITENGCHVPSASSNEIYVIEERNLECAWSVAFAYIDILAHA